MQENRDMNTILDGQLSTPYKKTQRCTVAHRSGDGKKAIIADQNDVEDRGSAEEVVHNQPQFTEPSTQHPFARQYVGHVHWNTESPCRKNTNQINFSRILNVKQDDKRESYYLSHNLFFNLHSTSYYAVRYTTLCTAIEKKSHSHK